MIEGGEIYMKTTIYYFTATGNCLDVARDIQKSLGETNIVSISSLGNEDRMIASTDRIGLVFPVYYYGIPLVVRDFLKKLDATNVKYAFAVATCNFLPGLALEQVDNLLKEKGKKLDAGFIIRMPGNYIVSFDANSQKTQEKKFREKNSKIKTIIDCIRDEKDYGIEKSKLMTDRILAPKMQKSIENFHTMDRNFWVDEKCNGCGTCKNVCAFNNIEMTDGKPQWQHQCQQCFACIQWCPKKSIQIGKKTVNNP